MTSRPHALARTVALLALGVLGVHWLRYVLAYGEAAGDRLHAQGHGYLSELLPGIVALSVAMIVASVALRVLTRSTARPRVASGGATLVFSCCLLAIYAAQELSEGLLASGEDSGFAAVTAGSGWVAIPIALIVGGALSLFERLLVRGEECLVEFIAASDTAGPPSQEPPRPHAPPFVLKHAHRALAFGFARRPPPLPSP